MTGQQDLNRAKIQQGGTEVFFHFVLLFPFFLDGGNQRTPVKGWHVKLLHAVKLINRGRMNIQPLTTSNVLLIFPQNQDHALPACIIPPPAADRLWRNDGQKIKTNYERTV